MQTKDTARSPRLQVGAMNQIPRGRPVFADSQRTEILELLREAGSVGVNRDFLIFTKHYTQCGARIHELQKMGYGIRSEMREGRRFVTYILVSEPAQPKPLPNFQKAQRELSRDWFVQTTGRERPQPTSDYGPLFSQTAGESRR
jgi:hypothetical protein